MTASVYIKGVLSKKVSAPRRSSGVKRPPLRTFKELCEECGVSMQVMRALLRYSTTAPKPTVYVSSVEGHAGRSFYPHAAFIKWFHEQRKEKENGKV